MKKLMQYGVLTSIALCMFAGVAAGAVDGADVWYKFSAEAQDTFYVKLVDPFEGATLGVFPAGIAEDRSVEPLVDPRPYTAPIEKRLGPDEEYFVRVAGMLVGDSAKTGPFKIVLGADSLEGKSITAEDADIVCDSFSADALDALHTQVGDAFRDIAAVNVDVYGDETLLTDKIRVQSLSDVEATYSDADLNEIATLMADRMNVEGYEYDGTVSALREMFHNHFMFKPGVYTVVYTLEDDLSVTAEQTITVADSCRGCLGCYSCNSCARCRPVPDGYMDLKRMMSDWLLIGLSMLVLMSWTALRKK